MHTHGPALTHTPRTLQPHNNVNGLFACMRVCILQASVEAVAKEKVSVKEGTEEPKADVPAWKRELQKKKAAKAAAENKPEAATTLPSDWQQHLDPASGRVFYRNSQTGITQWELPAEPVQAREVRSVAGELPQGWTTMRTEDGRKYFANTLTGKTQWEPPTCDK